jgi:hypothetical protein
VVSQTLCRIEVFPAFALPIMSTRNLTWSGTLGRSCCASIVLMCCKTVNSLGGLNMRELLDIAAAINVEPMSRYSLCGSGTCTCLTNRVQIRVNAARILDSRNIYRSIPRKSEVGRALMLKTTNAPNNKSSHTTFWNETETKSGERHLQRPNFTR